MKSKLIFCPRCSGSNIVSAGLGWRCKDCKREWRKVYKEKRWWNKGLTKETDPRIAEYGRKQSKTRKNNPKYARIVIENRLKSAKLEGKILPEEMQKLYNRLGNQKDVAEFLGVTQTAISYFMKKHKLKSNPQFDLRKYWDNITPEQKEDIYSKVSKSMKGNTNWVYGLYDGTPNKEEQLLIDLFKEFFIPLEFVGDGSFRIEGKNPDFVNRDRKKVLEYDCEFWHRIRPEGYDERRNEVYRRNGFDLLVLTGEDFKVIVYGFWRRCRVRVLIVW